MFSLVEAMIANYMKGYAKAYAEGNLLSRKTTPRLVDIEVLLQKTPLYSINGRVYAEIGGNTLVNWNVNTDGSNQCIPYNTPLSRSRYRLFRFTFSIFVLNFVGKWCSC